MIELTEQILETLSPQDIIYAEIADAGAMGRFWDNSNNARQ